MRETGFLFKEEMVRAILEGQKWVTRRLRGLEKINEWPGDNWRYDGLNIHGDHLFFDVAGRVAGHDPEDCVVAVKCPWGKPGDVMYAKETWQIDAPRDGTWGDVSFYGCTPTPWCDLPERFKHPQFCLYKASWTGIAICWRPSIFMPRWASRIRRKIVSVRPERLQDLTEDEAKAEGIRRFTKDGQLFKYWPCDPCGGESKCAWADLPRTAVEAYAALWDRINPEHPWSSNPWVWRIEFERK